MIFKGFIWGLWALEQVDQLTNMVQGLDIAYGH